MTVEERDAWLWCVVWAPRKGAPESTQRETIGALDTPLDGGPTVRHTWTREVAPELAKGRKVEALLAYAAMPSTEADNWPMQVVQIPKGARPICTYRRGIEVDLSGATRPAPPASLLIIGWERGRKGSKRGAFLFLHADGSVVLANDLDAVSVFA
jgi:hypothetical protein